MNSHTNRRGDGRDVPHRPVPAVPIQEDDIAAAMGDAAGDSLREENQRLAEAGRQRRLLENLFAEDPRRQFAALRQLEASTSVTTVQYERIRELRRQSPHLLIADQAEKLLHEKPRDGQEAISEHTRREVASLIEAQEERQRRRHARTAGAAATMHLSVVSLVGWIAAALAAGCAVGVLTSYAILPRQPAVRERSAEVYVDPRSGDLLCVDPGDAGEEPQPTPAAGYVPAFYCWKCRQWLPIRKPQKAGDSAAGPRQSLVERPLAPNDERSRKSRGISLPARAR